MPLDHVRVVDLSRVISGPFCSQLLADLGADIIKVEPREQGDPLREQGVKVEGVSSYFANYNRGKRSIALDLYSPEGKAVLTTLIASADVLLENFRPGILATMGFPKARLAEINPSLIHCNINGFGTDGPYAQRPAFDFILQAMSGFMACNGKATDKPMRSGVPIADLVSGLYAALAVTAALADKKRERSRTLSVSMLGSMMNMLSFHATDYLNSGAVAERTGNDHSLVAPYGLFATRDHPIAIAPSNEAFYRKLLDALDLHDLRDDPRFATNALRRARRDEVNGIVEARTRTASSDHWIDVLNRAGVPCGPVHDLPAAFADPQVISQGIAGSKPVGSETLSILASPIRDHDGEWPRPVGRIPGLGDDTAQILADAGYSSGAIQRLYESGVAGAVNALRDA